MQYHSLGIGDTICPTRMTSPDTETKSGRFLLRMPPPLHAALDGAARSAGLSLNEYCVRRLAAFGVGMDDGDAVALVARAGAVAGGALMGVLLHGSWIRGDATATSDVDAIVVVEPRVRLSRALYRTWDEQPVTWKGRPVDAHFVHPPATTPLAVCGRKQRSTDWCCSTAAGTCQPP